MDILKKLPQGLVNKVGPFYLEHPLATLFQKYVKVDFFTSTLNKNYIIMSVRQRENVQFSYIYDTTELVYDILDKRHINYIEDKISANRLKTAYILRRRENLADYLSFRDFYDEYKKEHFLFKLDYCEVVDILDD
jgi:hypothetical protein